MQLHGNSSRQSSKKLIEKKMTHDRSYTLCTISIQNCLKLSMKYINSECTTSKLYSTLSLLYKNLIFHFYIYSFIRKAMYMFYKIKEFL